MKYVNINKTQSDFQKNEILYSPAFPCPHEFHESRIDYHEKDIQNIKDK